MLTPPTVHLYPPFTVQNTGIYSKHGYHNSINLVSTSAGRSLGFSLSMFVSDICNQTSDISDYGVEV